MAYSTLELVGGSRLYYQLINSRMIEVFSNDTIDEIKENHKIIELNISNKKIRIGDIFDHNVEGIPSVYKIVKIESGGSVAGKYKCCYTLFSHIRNRATTYLLPMLGYDRNYFYEDSYLVNCYISQDRKHLYLLYRFATSESYGRLEKGITKHPNFIKVDNSIPGMDIYIMKIPDFYLGDVNLFLKGKYSKISPLLKSKIRDFYKLPERSKVWRILNKEDKLMKEMEKEYGCSLKDVDLDDKPNKEEEIWKN